MRKIPGRLYRLAWLVPLIALLAGGCATEEKSDAYGQFEAVETTISAEAGGKLLQFNINEGADLKAGQQVGSIDTSRKIGRAHV